MHRTGPHDYALLVIRASGLLLAFGHGWQKLFALLTGNGVWLVNMVEGLGFPLPTLFAWILAFAEFGGGLLVAFGLFTRTAAFFAAFAMFVAVFIRHGAITLFLAWLGISSMTPEQLEPYGNPERALLFLLAMIAVLIAGPGRLSIDTRLAERRR